MKVLPLLLIILFCAITARARQADTTFISASVSYTEALYNTRMKGEWPINSGGQYILYSSIEGEHPYFINAWSSGTVHYLNDVYQNVPLLLDIRSDRLITQHTQFDVKLELSPQKVKSFTLAGHYFVNISQDTIPTLPESGYYEVLRNGSVSLVARRKKTIKLTLTRGKVTAIVKETNLYYVLKEKTALPVKSKKSVFDALRDQPDLKRQLKKNRVKFGGNREAGLAATVQIYNELKQ